MRCARGAARRANSGKPAGEGRRFAQAAPSVMLRLARRKAALATRACAGQECERLQNESLRKASVGMRLAREEVARHGLSGMTASFAVDREKASPESKADVKSSGSGFDPVLEGARGEVIGRPARALVWSARLGRHVWWRCAHGRWDPEGVERAVTRKLRVELSDANEGRSVEEVLADRLEVA